MNSLWTALIFDLDDTLIDTSTVFFKVREHFINLMLAEQHPEELVKQILDQTEHLNIARFGYISERNLVTMREVYEDLTCRSGRQFSASVLRDIAQIGKHSLYDMPRPMPFLRPFLKWCKDNYRLALLTRGSRALQNAKLVHYGITEAFEVINIVPKKDASCFKSIVESLGCQPNHCVSIGDSLQYDVLKALETGMSAIHVQYPLPEIQWNHDNLPIGIEVTKYQRASNLRAVKTLLSANVR